MKLPHILRAQDFDWPLLETLFRRAEWLRLAFDNDSGGRDHLRRLYPRRLLYYLFYEVSTRTRLSFVAAACHLGMMVEGSDKAGQFTSGAKGERIEDTIRVISGYRPDVIVIRSGEEGAVAKAAERSLVPVINGGDGEGEHPTQALLDLYTIWREAGTLEGLHIAMGGDLLRGRTVHSLVRMLAPFKGTSFTFISLPDKRMKPAILLELEQAGAAYKEVVESEEVPLEALKDPQIFYWTRDQWERGGASESTLIIGREQVSAMREDAVLLHPLPRLNELPPEIDDDPRAKFFEQSDNGLWIRMALLEWVLGCLKTA